MPASSVRECAFVDIIIIAIPSVKFCLHYFLFCVNEPPPTCVFVTVLSTHCNHSYQFLSVLSSLPTQRIDTQNVTVIRGTTAIPTPFFKEATKQTLHFVCICHNRNHSSNFLALSVIAGPFIKAETGPSFMLFYSFLE